MSLKHIFFRMVPLVMMLTTALGTSASSSEPDLTFRHSKSSPLVAVRVLLNVGSQDDPKGKEGLAALTAAMVAEGGTRELTYDQVLERFYPMATALEGSCHKELTVFSGTVHQDNLAEFATLVSDMITNPRFAPEDFERLKTEALEFLTKTLRGGNDEELGKATLLLSLYPKDHPYGHVDVGTVAGLKAITIDDVRAFHKTHYAKNALRIGVAGGADKAFANHFVGRFEALAATGPKPPALPEVPMPQGLEVTIVAKPSAASTAISIGFPLSITRRDDDFYALAVANSYLGEHRTFNGKLMQDLRGKRGLNYGDYSYIEDFIQEGGSTFPIPNNPRRQQAFSIWARPVPNDKAVFALRAALWELDRLVKDGMTQADFDATREYLLNYSKLWVQTASRRLGYDMDGAFYGRKSLVDELADRLPRLTVEQVNEAVRKELKTKGLRVVIVASDAQELAKALKSGAASPITYDTQGTPEAILAEDKVIAAFPLDHVSVKIVPVEKMFEE